MAASEPTTTTVVNDSGDDDHLAASSACCRGTTNISNDDSDAIDTNADITNGNSGSEEEEEEDGWLASSSTLTTSFFLQQFRPPKNVVSSLSSTIRNTTNHVVQFVQQSAITIVNEMNAFDEEMNDHNISDNNNNDANSNDENDENRADSNANNVHGDEDVQDDDAPLTSLEALQNLEPSSTNATVLHQNDEREVQAIVADISSLIINNKENDDANNDAGTLDTELLALSSSYVCLSNIVDDDDNDGDITSKTSSMMTSRQNIPRAPYSATSIKSTDSMVFVDAVVDVDGDYR